MGEDVIHGCYYQNHKYIGDDLPNMPLYLGNFTLCQAACQASADCYFWGYFAIHQACYLGGSGAVYDNGGAYGAVCGPKYCPTIPSGCTDLPGDGFPGWTPDETEAMFTAHRQPEKLECWPTSPDGGWYDTCDTVRTLEDYKYG